MCAGCTRGDTRTTPTHRAASINARRSSAATAKRTSTRPPILPARAANRIPLAAAARRHYRQSIDRHHGRRRPQLQWRRQHPGRGGRRRSAIGATAVCRGPISRSRSRRTTAPMLRSPSASRAAISTRIQWSAGTRRHDVARQHDACESRSAGAWLHRSKLYERAMCGKATTARRSIPTAALCRDSTCAGSRCTGICPRSFTRAMS